MAIAARPTAKTSGLPATSDLPHSSTGEADLRSIAECLEAALAQVTFTTQEIEGVLALDSPSWELVGAKSEARPR